MRTLIILALALFCIANAVKNEDALKRCNCGLDYVAVTNGNGKVHCLNKQNSLTKTCNAPKEPRCLCRHYIASEIITDFEGTWCVFSERGQQKLKWSCENVEEWEAYKFALREYERSLSDTIFARVRLPPEFQVSRSLP